MDDWLRWARRRLPRAVDAQRVDNPGGEARVWRLCADGRALAYLKQHRVDDKWRRERALLEQLAQPPGAPVPNLRAADARGRVLLLDAVPGVRASPATVPRDQWPALHEQAGRFRRRLDRVPVRQPDPSPVPDAIERRCHAWSERARPHLPTPLLERVAGALDPRCFEGVTRRWCHRDLAPHNWIVQATDAGPRLAIIDFGQARPDVWLVDTLKLWDRDWLDDPRLADAFWTGYGRGPTAAERRQQGQLALLHGLATATWGERHADPELARHGRRTLDRALRTLEP